MRATQATREARVAPVALEVPGMPSPILGQGGHDLRGFASIAYQVAPGPLAARELQERCQFMGDSSGIRHHPEDGMVYAPAAAVGPEIWPDGKADGWTD